MSLKSLPELAFNISKIINSIKGKVKKCIILDLDNTCWGGLIGDVGVDEILLGSEDPVSEAYLDFQKYIKDLSLRGIILAVCSKNNHDIAVKGFEHSNSILSFDDFSAFYANWENKDDNIIKISKDLNIDISSMVFIDDSSFEREYVKKSLPEVAVPDIGENVENFIEIINNQGYFDTVDIGKDDLSRKEYYQSNKKRESLKMAKKSYNDYLLSLDMKARILPFADQKIQRITQLTNKTNQFNLMTQRFSLAKLQELSKSQNHICLYGELDDKFGSNGLVSIIIGEIQNTECHIIQLIMSCRVFKRGFEFALLDEFFNICKMKNIKKVYGYFAKTDKNSIVENFYADMGFNEIINSEEDRVFSIPVKNYSEKNKNIVVNDERK